VSTPPHHPAGGPAGPGLSGEGWTAAGLRGQAHQADVLAEQVRALLIVLHTVIATLPDRLAQADWGTDDITRAVDDLAHAAAAGPADAAGLGRVDEQLRRVQAAVAVAEQLGARVAELGAAGAVEAFVEAGSVHGSPCPCRHDHGQMVETNPASGSGPRESAAETINAFLEDYGSIAGPWGSDAVVLGVIAARCSDIADAYARGTLSPDVCFPEDQLADLAVRMDDVFQARRDQWCARHGLTGEQLVGLTLVDDAGHQLAVTAVRRDDDLRWAIIGTVTCPGCGSLAHGPVQENTEAAWATDEELQARYVYGWELPDPASPQTDPHDDLGPVPGDEAGPRPLRDDPAWLYRGLHGSLATRRLRVWEACDGALVAVVTEGPDDEGTSLANAAEAVIAQLQAEYPGREVEVIEHQMPRHLQPGDLTQRWSLTGLPAGPGTPDGVEYIELPPAPAVIPGGLERVLLDARGQATWWPITSADLARRLTGGAW
jgi:hypothetical protein